MPSPFYPLQHYRAKKAKKDKKAAELVLPTKPPDKAGELVLPTKPPDKAAELVLPAKPPDDSTESPQPIYFSPRGVHSTILSGA